MHCYPFHGHALHWLNLSFALILLWAAFTPVTQAARLTPPAPPTEVDYTLPSVQSSSLSTCAYAIPAAAPPVQRPQAPLALGNDVLVNNPNGEDTSMVQSDAAVAYNDDNGVLCAAYTDSYHGFVEHQGYIGFSSSSDGGATWSDHGSLLDTNSYGFPSLAWRRTDGHFYLATLYSTGLRLWDLGAGCSAATWVGMIHTGANDSKEMLAVDNNPASPYYGRFYTVWTDFSNGHIYATRSSDGQIWSAPVDISHHDQVNGGWAAVDPVSGDVYAAWTHWDVYPAGPIDVEMARSTDGGATWDAVANPMSDQVNPRQDDATTDCGWPALNGNMLYSPYPQIAVDHNRNLHVVYSYDPDGYNSGDVVNVYYRRSTDQGASWESEIRVNDNWNLTDQFTPALAVDEADQVAVFWYDRRLDATNNLMYDRYMAISRDGGLTFEVNRRISDASSPVTHDTHLATCYHGDRDAAVAGGGAFYTVWSDDRRGDTDVWSDSEAYLWGALSGTVYDASTHHGLPDAQVETVHAPTSIQFSGKSDAGGYYTLNVPSGQTYTVTAQVYGYAPHSITTTVSENGGQADIPLTPVTTWSVEGVVSDAKTGYPLRAHIRVSGDPFDPPAPNDETWSDPHTGQYRLTLAESVAYTFTLEAVGYISTTGSIGLLSGNATHNFALAPDLAACNAPGYEPVAFFYDGFESGGLGPAWSTTTISDGQVTVSTTYPYLGSYSVLLADAVSSGYSLAALNLSQDLSALNNVTMNFWWRSFDDEAHAEDGVFISGDSGLSWYPVFSFNNGPDSFRNDSVDITGAAGAYGLTLNDHFQIKFQFYDNSPIPDDGYAIDEVRLTQCQAVAGGQLWPAHLTVEGCPGSLQTYALAFANHTGADETVLITYTTSPGIRVLDIPTTLGMTPNHSTQPFEVQAQIDQSAPPNTMVTVTAYLASNPALSDTTVIEQHVAPLEAPWVWETDAPVTAFYRGAGATLDDYAYIIGGRTSSGAQGSVARYRPGLGWQTMDAKPTPASNIDAAELNGKIYVAGGRGSGGRLSAFEVFDPAQPAGDQWTTLAAALPTATEGGAMAAACDKVYFMGGNIASDASTNAVRVYDPANPGLGWDHVVSMPHAQRYSAAVAARGLIFVVGDWSSGTLVQVYDCAANAWLAGTPQLKVGRQAPGVALIRDRYVIVYGGGPPAGSAGQPDVEYLDLDNTAAGWQTAASMNQGRAGPGGGVSGGQLIAVGGNDADGHSTHTTESITICPQCGGLGIAKSGPAWAYRGDVVSYTLTITRPAWLTSTAILTDTLPTGVEFAGGLNASQGTAWYSDTAHAVAWTAPPVASPTATNDMTITFNTTVTAAAEATITNSAELDYASPGCQAASQQTFQVAPRAAVTWTTEVYANGHYLGQAQDGPFSVVPGDDIQIVDRLDYVGRTTLFAVLDRDWSGYPVVPVGEFHNHGVLTSRSGGAAWSISLLAGESPRWVKTFHVSATTPAVITQQLRPDGMAVEEHVVTLEAPTFVKDGPTTTYHGQVVTYTIAFSSHNPLLGPLWLTDALPPGVTYGGNLHATYGNAWYEAGANAIYWRNTPAVSLTQQTDVEAPVGTVEASLKLAPTENIPTAQSAGWFNAAPIPSSKGLARYAHAQCPGEPNRFYIISGTRGGASDDVWRYDADTDTWTALAAFPDPAEGMTAVCYGGRLYVAGINTSRRFYIYDIVQDSWSAGPSLPRRVWGAAMAAWDGRIYVAGGDNDILIDNTSNVVNFYEIASRTWFTASTTMPVAAFNPGFAQVGSYLYIVGGISDASPANNVTATQRYDMASNTWEVGPTFSSARADFTLAATGQYLYAIGGDQDGGWIFDGVALVERLDYTHWYSAAWSDIADPLPAALTGYRGGVCTEARAGGEVWSVGGIIPSPWGYTSTAHYRPAEACVTIPTAVTLTFTVQVTANSGQHITNTAYMNDHGYTLADQATMVVKAPPPTYTLAIHVTGNGSVARSPSQTVYISGTLVQLTATPDPGWHFIQWSGDVIAANNPTQLTMDRDKVVTATFSTTPPLTYTLSIQVVGNGSVARSPSQTVYVSGTLVQLTAMPDSGWAFTAWSGDLSGNTNPTSVTMDTHKLITATFSLCAPVSGASFTFAPPEPAVGQSITFTGSVASGATPVNYTWNWGDGSTLQVGNPAVHTFPIASTERHYTVVMTASNACPSQAAVSRLVTLQEVHRIYLPLVLRNVSG